MTSPNSGNDQSVRNNLTIIGLSDTEIDAYLALLARGEATTREVAEDTDVTQRAIYDIAERLRERGLVRVNDHASPTTVRALPPNDSVANIIDQLESIQPALENQYTKTMSETPEIQIVKSRDTALRRVKAAISAAEREIFLTIPQHIYPEIESELQAAIERDVFVLLLLSDASDPEKEGSHFARSADVVRYCEESLTFLYVIDDTSAMIGDPVLLSGSRDSDEAVVVSQRNLADSILGLNLSGYWPLGKEEFVTDPDPLPRTFNWFRKALFHAMLHHHMGTELWADIETVDGVEIAGPVSQIRQALVEPVTNEFTLEASLCVEINEEEVSIGGWGSFAEDHIATSITLRRDT